MISTDNFKTICDWLGSQAYQLQEANDQIQSLMDNLSSNFNRGQDSDIDKIVIDELNKFNFDIENLFRSKYGTFIQGLAREIEQDYYGGGYRYSNGFNKFAGENNVQIPAYFARLADFCGYTILSDYIFYEINDKLATISYDSNNDISSLTSSDFDWADFGQDGAADYFGSQPGGMVRYENDTGAAAAFTLVIHGRLNDNSVFKEDVSILLGDTYVNTNHTRIKSISRVEYKNMSSNDTANLSYIRVY